MPRFLAAIIPVMAAATPVAAQAVASEDLSVPYGDVRDEVRIHVRNKRPAGVERFAFDRIVVFMHGATYPSTAFDVAVGGKSWMDYMAERGFDTYALDLPGYGRSTRPAAMDGPPDAGEPYMRGTDAVKALGAVVDHVRARRGAAKVSLVGWSWGTTLTATYASECPDKVARLVLFAPSWIRTSPSLVRVDGRLGTYRIVSRAQARERWLTDVPEASKTDLVPEGWFEQWADATFATDPKGGGTTLRAPNGVIRDGMEFHGGSPPRPYYDPARITAPVLLVLGEWDRDTPPYMAQALFPLLANAAWKRLSVLSGGTHTMLLEKNRMLLLRTVQQFLEEAPPGGSATE